MITPKLTAVMVVMTALMGATPIAALAQAESGDSNGENSESSAQASALSVAIGGDAEAESGDVFAIQVIEGNEFDNNVDQTSTTTQVNALSDDDAVTVTQTNVPVQTQEDAVALNIVAEGLTAEELDVLLEGLLGGGPCPLICVD